MKNFFSEYGKVVVTSLVVVLLVSVAVVIKPLAAAGYESIAGKLDNFVTSKLNGPEDYEVDTLTDTTPTITSLQGGLLVFDSSSLNTKVSVSEAQIIYGSDYDPDNNAFNPSIDGYYLEIAGIMSYYSSSATTVGETSTHYYISGTAYDNGASILSSYASDYYAPGTYIVIANDGTFSPRIFEYEEMTYAQMATKYSLDLREYSAISGSDYDFLYLPEGVSLTDIVPAGVSGIQYWA